MNRQLRFDFPDYSARQQEIDAKRAERLKQSDVYLSKVDGVWNAIIPRRYNYVINGHKGEELTQFCEGLVKSMAEDFNLKPVFHCIRNQGIDAHFRHNQAIIRRLNDMYSL